MSGLESFDVMELVGTVLYAFLGLGLFIACWWVIERITPFSLRREIEQDQNMAIAVLIGALFISLAIIIAAVIIS